MLVGLAASRTKTFRNQNHRFQSKFAYCKLFGVYAGVIFTADPVCQQIATEIGQFPPLGRLNLGPQLRVVKIGKLTHLDPKIPSLTIKFGIFRLSPRNDIRIEVDTTRYDFLRHTMVTLHTFAACYTQWRYNIYGRIRTWITWSRWAKTRVVGGKRYGQRFWGSSKKGAFQRYTKMKL